MKFLADQDIWKTTIDHLRKWGHDIMTAQELKLHTASDETLLKVARKEHRIFITRDKDFGELVFLKEELSYGVILLRSHPKMIVELHNKIHLLLNEHDEKELNSSFCVVEPDKYRIRHL